jgi:hypothetical protein
VSATPSGNRLVSETPQGCNGSRAFDRSQALIGHVRTFDTLPNVVNNQW